MLTNRQVRWLFAGVGVGYTLWTASRRRELEGFGRRVFGVMLVLMPVVNSWYVTWVLIFTVFALRWSSPGHRRTAPARGDEA